MVHPIIAAKHRSITQWNFTRSLSHVRSRRLWVLGLIEKADPRAEEVRRPRAKRADIRTNALGTTVRVVPVFSQSSSSDLVAKQLERQATQDDPLVVVLPLNTPGTEPDRRQGVLTLHDLRAQLRHP